LTSTVRRIDDRPLDRPAAVHFVSAGFFMRALLVGVSPIDPLALGGAGVLLVVGAWLASLASSRRATTVQPAEVLRD